MAARIRRFGVLVPPGNVAVEAEFRRFLPAGVEGHASRLYRRTPEVTYEGHLEMLRSVETAAASLAQVAPEVILFCCTSASFMQGRGKDTEIADGIRAKTGIPAIATATAVAAALAALGAKRIYMVTPYRDDFNQLEVKFMGEHGVAVPELDAFRCRTTVEIRDIESATVAELVLANRAKAAAADAVFISCTNLHSMDQIARLEAELKKPVVTSNSATLWAGLSAMGISGAGLGAGRLFEIAPAARPARRQVA